MSYQQWRIEPSAGVITGIGAALFDGRKSLTRKMVPSRTRTGAGKIRTFGRRILPKRLNANVTEPILQVK
jgi:hypothetical protein